MQLRPHAPALHVGRERADPPGHAVQAEPHAAATPSPTQLPVGPPQRVLPLAQVVPQVMPSQVGTAPGTPGGHRVQVAPHAVTSVALAHSPLQGLKPLPQVKAH